MLPKQFQYPIHCHTNGSRSLQKRLFPAITDCCLFSEAVLTTRVMTFPVISWLLSLYWRTYRRTEGVTSWICENISWQLFPSWQNACLKAFHALILIAWLADGDSLMCCIVMMGRLIAKMFSTFSLWGSVFLMLYVVQTQIKSMYKSLGVDFVFVQPAR